MLPHLFCVIILTQITSPGQQGHYCCRGQLKTLLQEALAGRTTGAQATFPLEHQGTTLLGLIPRSPYCVLSSKIIVLVEFEFGIKIKQNMGVSVYML